MAGRKRLLFLAPRLPLPADTGGKIRTLNILKQLAKRFDIRLVCFSFSGDDRRLSKDIEAMGVPVTLIPAQETGVFAKIGHVLFNPQPYSIAKYRSPRMKAELENLKKYPCDAAHIDHLHMAHYRGCFDGLPCVLDEHNVEYKILERCAHVERTLWKRIVFRMQAKKMRQFEAARAREFSRCLTVSDDDQKILTEITGGAVPVAVAANGVDTEFFTSGAHGKPEEDALVFTGSMDWLPNNDAVVYFCKEILPLIWKVKKQTRFYIVGKDPSPAILAMARDDQRIIVTGRVDDVRVFMEPARVFVVPIRVGGGTRLKILEALSMQKAVVSTAVGAEGIAHTNGENIVIADDPAPFAQRVLELLDDEPKRKALGIAGRHLVRERYDWNVVGERLGRIYEEVLHARANQG